MLNPRSEEVIHCLLTRVRRGSPEAANPALETPTGAPR
jgi:hypothetical protein